MREPRWCHKTVPHRDPLPRRFWAKVHWVRGCYEWTGARSHGYGLFWFKGRTIAAHKLVYNTYVGPVPSDRELDHICDNRRCVNPAHLRSLPHRENTIRRFAALTHCPRGHAYTETNLEFRPRGAGINRRCRICHMLDERRRARKKAGRATAQTLAQRQHQRDSNS